MLTGSFRSSLLPVTVGLLTLTACSGRTVATWDLSLDAAGITLLNILDVAGEVDVKGRSGTDQIEATVRLLAGSEEIDAEDCEEPDTGDTAEEEEAVEEEEEVDCDELEQEAQDQDDADAWAESVSDPQLVASGDTAVLSATFAAEVESGYSFAVDVSMPDSLRVNASGVQGDLRIRHSAAVNISDEDGQIEVRQISGGVTVDDGSGRLRVRDVEGSVSIVDGPGRIIVKRVQGDVVIQDGSGGVKVTDVDGAVDVQSESGRVVIRRSTVGR